MFGKSSSPLHSPATATLRIFASTPDGNAFYLAGGANQGNPMDEKQWGRVMATF